MGFPTEFERKEIVAETNAVLNEIPPPPTPLLMISPGAATVSGSGAGLAGGFMAAVLSNPQAGIVDGLTRSPILWWMVLGIIIGGVSGGVGSLIYNTIVRSSSAIKAFQRRYPEAGTRDPDKLLIHWIEVKLARLFRYGNDTFQKTEPGTPGYGSSQGVSPSKK